MDVPTWHPAASGNLPERPVNEARTEVKVMQGSSLDTSTDAGKILLDEVNTNHTAGFMDGKGIFDASDRLYLKEQLSIEKEKEYQAVREREQALRKFREAALEKQRKAAAAIDQQQKKEVPTKSNKTVSSVIKAKQPTVKKVKLKAKVKKSKNTTDTDQQSKSSSAAVKPAAAVVVKTAQGWTGIGYDSGTSSSEED